ncbi:MAG: hypothetical protein LBI85_07870, partial [Spirochaetaceae bacterium]|jgi:hypothetical protein|nr:hypothetical protein [Spirochaetaceae bacterium]
VKNLKQDMPVYIFTISLAVLTVLSLVFLDADWQKLAQRFPRLGKVFIDMAHFSTERFHSPSSPLPKPLPWPSWL